MIALAATVLGLVAFGYPFASWLHAPEPPTTLTDPTAADVAYGRALAAGKTREGIR